MDSSEWPAASAAIKAEMDELTKEARRITAEYTSQPRTFPEIQAHELEMRKWMREKVAKVMDKHGWIMQPSRENDKP